MRAAGSQGTAARPAVRQPVRGPGLAGRQGPGQAPSAGSSTKTGIVREVRSWYSAYGG